jgi:hypothetical protein
LHQQGKRPIRCLARNDRVLRLNDPLCQASIARDRACGMPVDSVQPTPGYTDKAKTDARAHGETVMAQAAVQCPQNIVRLGAATKPKADDSRWTQDPRRRSDIVGRWSASKTVRGIREIRNSP